MFGGKCNLAPQTRKFAKSRWHQDTSLTIDRNLMRAADVERLEELRLAVGGTAAAELRNHFGPFVGRVQLEQTLPVQDEISDIKSVMTLTLQDLTKPGGDTTRPLSSIAWSNRPLNTASLPHPPQHPTLSHHCQ